MYGRAIKQNISQKSVKIIPDSFILSRGHRRKPFKYVSME
jgi:hypothetical protein